LCEEYGFTIGCVGEHMFMQLRWARSHLYIKKNISCWKAVISRLHFAAQYFAAANLMIG